MSRKLNLAFMNKKEEETARRELSNAMAGKKTEPNFNSSTEGLCDCDPEPIGYDTLEGSYDFPEPDCDCGWNIFMTFGMMDV